MNTGVECTIEYSVQRAHNASEGRVNTVQQDNFKKEIHKVRNNVLCNAVALNTSAYDLTEFIKKSVIF